MRDRGQITTAPQEQCNTHKVLRGLCDRDENEQCVRNTPPATPMKKCSKFCSHRMRRALFLGHPKSRTKKPDQNTFHPALSTAGPLWKKIEFQAARVDKFQAAALFFTGNSQFYSQPGRIQQGSNKQNSSSTAANKKNAVNCTAKKKYMESQQRDLEENCPIDHEKIGGCHSNHKPKSCVPAPLGPDLQLICSCFALFLV